MGDPEQADDDVEAEYEREHAHDVARRDPNRFAGWHGGMLSRAGCLREPSSGLLQGVIRV